MEHVLQANQTHHKQSLCEIKTSFAKSFKVEFAIKAIDNCY